jgi:hypothetical protein
MTFRTIAAAALLFAAAPAFAHGDDKPRHGGQVVEVGDTVFELVRAPAGVSLFVMEDGDEVPSASASGKLVVTTGAKKSEVALVAAGGNRYIAKGATIPGGSRVGVLLVNNTTKARQMATFQVK